MVSKGFPNVTTSGRQYNIGEKPSVILYTYIDLHAGTPKPQSLLVVVNVVVDSRIRRIVLAIEETMVTQQASHRLLK